MSNSSLPKSLWMNTLKTSMYLLNVVPSKVVCKNPFKLQTNKKLNLRHLHVQCFLTEAREYNLCENQLDSQIVNGYFIGNPEKSKGNIFYCPNHSLRIMETSNAKFLENGVVGMKNNRIWR